MILLLPSRAAFFRKFYKNPKFMKITEYIKETKGELKHVNWPTRKQTLNFTLLVIGVSIVTAIVLGILDFIFSLGLERIIVR